MPGAVAPVVAIVSVLLVAAESTGFAENVPVTPAGGASKASVTSPAKPPVRATVSVVLPLAPATTLSAAGVADTVTAGVAAAVNVSANEEVWVVTPGPAALTVTVLLPAVAELATARLSVLMVDPAAIVAGVKVGVTPAGSPLTVSVTASVKPFERVIVMGTVPDPPTTIELLPLPTVSATAGVGTDRVYVAVTAETPGPVARSVIALEPGAAVAPTANDTLLLELLPASCDGVKFAVTPAGTPSAVRLTVPVYPPTRERVTPVALELPLAAVPLLEDSCTPMLCDTGGVVVPPSPPEQAANNNSEIAV